MPRPQPTELSSDDRRALLTLARRALEARVCGRKAVDAAGMSLSAALLQERGAFVTLEKNGRLRGCIGYVHATKPLWQTVVENAVNAGMSDPRFHRVTADELPEIRIEISAMTPLETVRDPAEVEVGRHGIMISRGYHHGLLLPQVATDYGWSREEFLAQTCRKAGLPDEAWKDPKTTIEIFSAEVFGEEN